MLKDMAVFLKIETITHNFKSMPIAHSCGALVCSSKETKKVIKDCKRARGGRWSSQIIPDVTDTEFMQPLGLNQQ